MTYSVSLLFRDAVGHITAELCPEGNVHSDCTHISVKNGRITLNSDDVTLGFGAASICTVRCDKFAFSFFWRDISSVSPVWIEEYGVAVIPSSDPRDYREVVRDITSAAGKSELEKLESDPEESFEACTDGLRRLECPTWLGISRDIRMFEIGVRNYCGEIWDTIQPFMHYPKLVLEDLGNEPVNYRFMTGRGIGPENSVKRFLEDGVLPVLNSVHTDNGIEYHTQYFATLETGALRAENIIGTDMFVADACGAGCTFTSEQQRLVDERTEQDKIRCEKETVVLYIRVIAKNNGPTPRYSFVKLPDPFPHRSFEAPHISELPKYDSKTGFGILGSGRVYLLAELEGAPCPTEELSVLIPAHSQITYIFKLPHMPLSHERAKALASQRYDLRLEECRRFWYAKLDSAAKINLPERMLTDRIRAGLLHIELGYFGTEPASPVVPSAGVYTAIGSESSPGIQFLDSMGLSGLAERSLEFFLQKQHDDGFMQNLGGYMLETGFVLWSMGEHYLYTRDDAWAKRIADKVSLACEYQLRWRERNFSEELRSHGYGMIDGKVADPNDFFHSFMLNSGAYAGLRGSSILLKNVSPELSEKYSEEAFRLRLDIMDTLRQSIAEAPVIPLGNGRWIPSFSPWAEHRGAISLYNDGGRWYSCACNMIRDILGVEYLPLHGVLSPDDPICGFMENFFAEFICSRNVAFSQPYYSPHPYLNLRRGHIRAFLKEFYTACAALADRDTYSFYEHFWHCSVHKLHEECWFLMRCRWMLWTEADDTLMITPGIPARWITPGCRISVRDARCYFGKLSFEIDVRDDSTVSVYVALEGAPPPKITVRLPKNDTPLRQSSMGLWDAEVQTVMLSHFDGHAEFEVKP